jgi:hypothetical protein
VSSIALAKDDVFSVASADEDLLSASLAKDDDLSEVPNEAYFPPLKSNDMSSLFSFDDDSEPGFSS